MQIKYILYQKMYNTLLQMYFFLFFKITSQYFNVFMRIVRLPKLKI
jgi:hypothetical protein